MEHVTKPLGAYLVNGFGDRYLYAVNRGAFNSIGSDALYRSLYGDAIFGEYRFNIVVGTDSGIFPKFIAKNGVPAGSRYLFIELPNVLEVLRGSGMLEDLPEEIQVVPFEGWLAHAIKYKLENYVFLNAVWLQGSLASSDANLPEYRELSWTLGMELESYTHTVQSATNCNQFILRQIENLQENRLSFEGSLVGAFAGKTAVILAGGPSLTDALPWVKQNRDRVLVIAASRISRILLDNGIVPHIITTVDPQKISFEVSREMLRFAESDEAPILVNSHHASPLLVGQWAGRSVYTASLFPWRTELNTDSLFFTGPTVGNYALSVAMHLGCSEIILAGVDLCFSPKGQTHAAGSNENKVGPDLGQISPRLETYGGSHADTNQGYAQALSVLATQAYLAREGGHRVYNCSLNAAKVALIDYLPLDTLELPEARITPSQILTERVPAATSKARLGHYRLVYKELSGARRKLQEILNLSREALDCADGLFGTNGKHRDFRYKIRMDKIENRLDKSFGSLTVMLKQVGIKKFLTILNTPEHAEDWTDEQIEKATRDYYETYVEGAEYFIGIVDGALRRVESRMEEEKAHPVFEKLFSQWQNDQQPGRLEVWRKHHADRLPPMGEHDQEAAAELELEFQRTLTEERTSQMEVLEKGHDVKHTRSKALLLFARRELSELEIMVLGLTEHPDQEKVLPYLHFINGLIAELRGDPDRALACYQHLVEESHPLTEDALQQIAGLALTGNDAEGALLALDCLAGLSPAYLPPYADLLKAVGLFEDAFNCYNRYIGLVPDDVGAIMKFALLCKEAGINDAARELFGRVLAQDPLNAAAQMLLDGLPPAAPQG
jgi:tetratricopeptide (TPR) repeat protein